ncbi:MAG TPA: VCBS repeat-containing protein [Terracidiphilus sp.]
MKNLRCPVVATGAAMFGLFASHPALSQTVSKQFVIPQQLNGIPGETIIGVADLNGDGRPDIVYQNHVAIATGNGTFKIISGNSFKNAAALADINGDGKPDVIEAIPSDEVCFTEPDGTLVCDRTTDAMVQVFLGKGDGTFTSSSSFDLGPDGAGLASISMVDVNGDGKPDAIVSFTGAGDAASQTGYVVLNEGTGKLAPGTYGDHPVLAFADLNGDGHVDLIVGPGLEIFWGKGDGSFTPGPSYAVTATSAALGDFNHDGHLDLAATSFTQGSTGLGLSLLWGQAGGTFAAPHRISTLSLGEVQAVDLNHDGFLDLVTGYAPIAVFTNQKNGTFSSPRLFSMENLTAGNFYLSDFNRDGYLDLVQGTTIGYGTSGASFQVPQITQSAFASNTAVADFNDDGIDDVATINSTTGTVTVFTGSGKGYLNAGKSYSTGIVGGTVSVGDVNGDGAPDLVITRTGNGLPNASSDVSVLLNLGDGTFGSAISSKVLGKPVQFANTLQVYAVDVNHDGKADLVGDWGVALGHGDGTFSAPKAWPSQISPVAGLAVGDLNHDSNLDVVVGNLALSGSTPTYIYTLFGDGKGGFTIAHKELLNYTNTQLDALTVADMNNDGALDLIYNYSATPAAGSYSRIVVETNDGSGNFGNATGQRVIYNGSGYQNLLVGDFNRDGKLDVLDLTLEIYLSQPEDSALLLGNGDGTLGSPLYQPLQMFNGAMIDLNGDGALDIVGPDFSFSGVARVLNTGAK